MKAKALGVWIFIFLASLNLALAADSGAPVIAVDGVAATSSPVVKGTRATISMSTSFAGGAIFYTLDGSEPSGASTRYTGSFSITQTRTIRAIAYSLDFLQTAQSVPLVVQIVPTVTLVLNYASAAGDVTQAPTPSGGLYLSNTVVRLTPKPKSGWMFLRWEGSASGSENPKDITLDGNKTVTAIFATSVNVVAPAHGSIHANKSTAVLVHNESLILTPIPEDGYYLAAWGGAAAGAAVPLVFPVLASGSSISALFLPVPAGFTTLSVFAQDDAGGTAAIRSPRRGAVTTNLYPVGDYRLLVATPNPGWTFTGWTGDLTSTNNPALVRLDGPKVIAAQFQPGSSIQIKTSDGGSVTRSPEQAVYPTNAVVQVQAVAEPGFTFGGWSGSVVSMDNPLTVRPTSNLVLWAKFDAPRRPAKWTYTYNNQFIRAFAAHTNGDSYVVTSYTMARVDAAGNFKKRFPPDEMNFLYQSALDVAVDPQGFVVLTSAGEPYFREMTIDRLSPSLESWYELSLNWTIRTFSLGRDGTIFTPQNLESYPSYAQRFIAYGSDLTQRWQFSADFNAPDPRYVYGQSFTRPAVGLDNRIYFSGRPALTPPDLSRMTNSVYCLDPNGALVWQFVGEAGNEIVVNQDPVLGRSAVYVIDGTGRLVALNLDGVLQWDFRTAEVLNPPSIGADGALYLGARDSANFYALNPDGSVRWVRQLGKPPYGVPAIGSDGTIYISDSARIHALDANGRRLWQTDFPGTPLLNGTNLFYTSGGTLFALEPNAPGVANSPWPMFDANPQQTSLVQAVIDPPSFNVAEATFHADGFHLVIDTTPGATVDILHSTDLVNWSVLSSESTASGHILFVHPFDSASPHFYQAVQR